MVITWIVLRSVKPSAFSLQEHQKTCHVCTVLSPGALWTVGLLNRQDILSMWMLQNHSYWQWDRDLSAWCYHQKCRQNAICRILLLLGTWEDDCGLILPFPLLAGPAWYCVHLKPGGTTLVRFSSLKCKSGMCSVGKWRVVFYLPWRNSELYQYL